MAEATEAMMPGAETPAAIWSPLRRHYLLAMVSLVGIFNFIDRQIISILLEPIKHEFQASDTEMGLLTGLIFATFYALASIPLARLADRYSRKWIISISLLVWSVCTSLGGLAQNFVQLAFSRLGVAVAEGGAIPISHSIISDLYPKSSRARAFAMFGACQALGVGISVFAGGWLSQHFGWRTTLLLVGLPGILLFLLMMITVREPPRGMADKVVALEDAPPIGAALRTLWELRSFRCLVLTSVFCGIAGLGVLSWGPAFLIRIHGMSQVQVGTSFGIAVSASLVIGALTGGVLGDRFGRAGVRGYAWLVTLGPVLSVVPGMLFAFSADWRFAVASLFLWSLLLTTYQPIFLTIAQTIVPIRIRATASVVLALGTGFVGTGAAPVLIGALNDLFAPSFGVDAIRLSLAITSLFAALGGLTALLAVLWLPKDSPLTRPAA
jgi:MFS family permease